MEEIRWIQTNITLEDTSKFEEDYFKDVYDNPWINRTIVGLYFGGFVSIIGLIFVVWFERSGQAGPYRTLINQLVIFNIESVRIFFESTHNSILTLYQCFRQLLIMSSTLA